MALATTLLGKARPDVPDTMYGVMLHLTPNPTRIDLQIEVQRAPDLAGAPDTGNAISLDTHVGPFPPTGGRFIDPLPNDGAKRWYRARHVGESVDAGAWTAWVGSIPYRVPLTRWVPQSAHAPFDGMAATSSWQNPQASTPVTLSSNSPITSTTICPSVSGRGQIRWTWSAFTIYRADGSTIAVAASSAMTKPGTPTLGQVAGGALGARTRWVRVALCKDAMMFGISPETSFAVSANNLLKVTSPAAVAGFDGWIPLCSDSNSNNVCMQPSKHPDTPIAFGVDWTEPTTGIQVPDGNRSQYNDNNVDTGAFSWDLAASTTYYYYPYWDVLNGLLAFAGGHGTSKSEAKAQSQNGDGHVPLSAGNVSTATPAAGGSGGNGGGGSGSCLAPAMLIDIRRRGIICAAELAIGDEIAAPGGWRIVRRIEWRSQEWLVDVTLANGAIARVSPTHPFTTEVEGIPRTAEELQLHDLLVVPEGFAEVIGIRRVASQEKVVLEVDGDHTFWAGMEPGRWILCHNAQINS
jgi:hypothetical protein